MGSTTTYASGGYSLDLAPGMYNIRFVDAVGRFYDAGAATIGSVNVKLDAINPVFAIPEPSPFILIGIVFAVLGRWRSGGMAS